MKKKLKLILYLKLIMVTIAIGPKIVKNKIYTYNVIRRRKGGMILYVENHYYL